MNKSPLGVHEVELMVQPGPGLRDGRGVGEHADGPLDLGEVASRNHGRRLVVDSNLEPSGAPVNKLDAPLSLDGGNGSIDILGNNISPVEKAAGHVLPMAGITLHHLVGRLKAGVGDLSNGDLLMVGLLRGDDGGIGHQREVDPWVGNQVGLELSKVNIEGSIKPQGSSDGGNNLANQTVKVSIGRSLDVKVPSADVIDGFVVNHERTVGVLQGGMGGQDSIVRFNNSSSNLGSRVD